MRALGITPVILPADAAARFQPTVALLDRLDPPPDGLIVASPGNPTGTMLHPDEIGELAAWCAGRGVRLISDEIYHGLNWDVPIDDRGGDRRRGGNQQLFEIFFHGGMAGRLGGAAAGFVAHGGAAGAELFHLRAARITGGGGSRVRLRGRTAAERGALPAGAGLFVARPAAGGIFAAFAGRGRVLSVRRLPTAPATVWLSAGVCWRKRMLRRRRAWISMPNGAGISCGSVIAGRLRICTRGGAAVAAVCVRPGAEPLAFISYACKSRETAPSRRSMLTGASHA